MLLLLYARTGSNSSSSSSSGRGTDSSSATTSRSSRGSDLGDVLVRLVYNEQVIRVPGCPSVDPDGCECTLQDFLQYVVGDKTAADTFQRYCYGHDVGSGLRQSAGSPGSADGASSSSSSRSSSRVGSIGTSHSGSDRSEGISGGAATVRTADGLQLVLGQHHSSIQLFLEE
jgi:hypothetical protein